jgi:signal transduction histidine kinase
MKVLEAKNEKYNQNTLNKGTIVLLLRWIMVLGVMVYWFATSEDAMGIALILVLSSTALIRMQFTESFWLILLEELTCLLAANFWPMAVFAIVVPVFEAGIGGKLLTLLPALIIILYKTNGMSLLMLLVLSLMCFIIGYIIHAWSVKENLYLKAADSERRQRYQVEQLKNELLTANHESAKLAEISERNRIAQQLHDNVGHELAGALIALQTYKKLEESKDDRAKEMFDNVLKRVESSSIKLREAVYELKPDTYGGVLRLQKLCEEFRFCPIDYRFLGDKDRVPVTIWIILEPCLKEALTNITKYSKATEINIRFDITQYIVRMNIKDNGVGAREVKSGMGLFGISERIRAAGGTMSIDSTNGFMITCILPIEKQVRS